LRALRLGVRPCLVFVKMPEDAAASAKARGVLVLDTPLLTG
jgi:type IV secretory pathway protease TraF